MTITYTETVGGTKTTRVEYEGRVVATVEKNLRDDSYGYAIVAEEDGTFTERLTWTSAWGGEWPSVQVSASPELKAAYEAHLAAQDRLARAQRVVKGDTVVVVRGRKIAKGTQGVVFWVGEKRWGHTVTKRVGFMADGCEFFTDAHNVENIDLAAARQAVAA